MNKSVFAALVVVLALGFSLSPRLAFANKVDCTKVMAELNGGKKAKTVAQDLKISTSSVYRCKKKAGAAGKPGAKSSPTTKTASTTAHH